jgi:hypothetical protein
MLKKQFLCKMCSDGWEHVAHVQGVTVWKKFLHPEDTSREQLQGSKFACVKVFSLHIQTNTCTDIQTQASGVINAAPADVFRLFLDNSRVHEYNEHCKCELVPWVPRRMIKHILLS